MPFEPLRSLRPWIAGALALGLVATGGCFNDDDAPGGSSDTANIDDEVAWGTASNAVDATQAILENIGDWTQNGIQATGRAQSASWDPVTGAWTITGNEDYDDGDATGSTTFTFVVQFSAAGTPQQQPDDLTDRIDVTLDATNEGNYHPSTETWTIDYDWAAHSEATATALAGGGGALVGTGTITGSTVAHIGEAAIPGSQDLSWDIDLVMPDGSCPTGTVSGEMAPWSFTAVLDGTTEMVVTLYHNGAYVASEIDEAPCGGGNTGQATYYTLEGATWLSTTVSVPCAD